MMNASLRRREHHTDTTVDFTVTMTEAGLKAVAEKGIVQFFKLQTKMSTSNMMLFDADGLITKYNSPEHILRDFFALRLDHYEKRRVQLLARAQNQLLRISNKARPPAALLACRTRMSSSFGVIAAQTRSLPNSTKRSTVKARAIPRHNGSFRH